MNKVNELKGFVKSNYEAIDNEKQIAIIKAIRSTDDVQKIQRLKQQLFSSSLAKIQKEATRYSRVNVHADDLIQESYLAFEQALASFDSTLDIKFITHFMYQMKDVLGNFVNQDSQLIRLPMNQIRKHHKEMKIKNLNPEFELSVEMPSFDKIDAPAFGEETMTYGEIIADVNNDVETEIDTNRKDVIVNSLLSGLNDEDKNLMESLYGFKGECMTYDEISEMTGKSRQCEHMRAKRVIANLKNKMNKNLTIA